MIHEIERAIVAQYLVWEGANRISCPSFVNFSRQAPPQRPKSYGFCKYGWKVFNIPLHSQRLRIMSAIEGYCMKCKTYGPIKDGQKIAMANGRTRMAGFCSQEGCTGKISKIIA